MLRSNIRLINECLTNDITDTVVEIHHKIKFEKLFRFQF